MDWRKYEKDTPLVDGKCQTDNKEQKFKGTERIWLKRRDESRMGYNGICVGDERSKSRNTCRLGNA